MADDDNNSSIENFMLAPCLGQEAPCSFNPEV